MPTNDQQEPVDRDDVAYRCRIDCYDENLDAIITAARMAAEAILKGSIVKQKYQARFRQRGRLGSSLLRLPYPPQLSVESVSFDGGGSVLDPGTYRFIQDSDLSSSIELDVPVPVGEITVTYTAGYDNPSQVPEDIKTAIYMLCSHIYEQYNATSDVQLSEIPFGVNALLKRYRESTYY